MASLSMPKQAVDTTLVRMADGELAVNIEKQNEIDPTMEVEIQTDKDMVKIVGCRECKRPLVVTSVYAPAKAMCNVCKGGTGKVATIGQPVPGQTDPAKAVNLADCLVNVHFAQALCPVHPDDEDHVMELKAVSHSPHYGPGHYGPKGAWIQDAPGEVVTHQCTKCLAVVNYSTTFRSPMIRQNAKRDKPDLGAPEENYIHGVEGDIPPANMDLEEVAA